MKPIEITRIFGHLDRDPMAVAEVIARMPTGRSTIAAALERLENGGDL